MAAGPGPAVHCSRLTALTVLAFGVTGYFSAALRAHRSVVPPAAIHVAYNLCIIGTMPAPHAAWGVGAAAAGVALGGVATALVHRFLASPLPAGAISQLNYAQKAAQSPMVLSLMLCTVAFPVVARAVADGAADRARRRRERDPTPAELVVLPGTAYVIACAPQAEVLFRRGVFTAATAATASVMRVHALWLLGHGPAGALIRPFSAAARPTWYPAAAMAAGLLLTVVAGLCTVRWWGAHGIAAANDAGITATALLMLRGLGTRVVTVEVRRVAAGLGRPPPAAATAAAMGDPLAAQSPPPLLGAAAGALLVPPSTPRPPPPCGPPSSVS
ncbi:lipid II flippase MurJ [Streptomyces halobius]|uniref:lipid II flippase MurJ n=1 Tax=Streptomyces halobius TaxID=2879846 RepID=UPI0029E7D8BB|nr:lipid II flippase MurJ [Streptomyces halobius]